MEDTVYLIEQRYGYAQCRYYAEHGEMAGVPDAVGYDSARRARKFRTAEDAQRYIDNEMPEWSRRESRVTEMEVYSFVWDCPNLVATIFAGEPIPEELLEPAPGLHIWRR